jgi:hypothetical protein
MKNVDACCQPFFREQESRHKGHVLPPEKPEQVLPGQRHFRERQGASRRYLHEKTAASALPLTNRRRRHFQAFFIKVALSN